MTPFEVKWRNAAKTGMSPSRVIPTFDVGKQREPCFGFALEAAPVDQLAGGLLAMERYEDPVLARELGWDAEAVAARGLALRREEGRP